MKPRQLFTRILAVLFTIPLAGTVAQGATIEVIETFDYPLNRFTRDARKSLLAISIASDYFSCFQ